ncbi:MAG: hypothetical protein RQM92_09205 [Candidatus Syntrophopropionicum ammoniitolerans]
MSLAAKKECASLEQVFLYQERKLQELVSSPLRKFTFLPPETGSGRH